MKINLILISLIQLYLINAIYGSQSTIKLKNGAYSNVIFKIDESLPASYYYTLVFQIKDYIDYVSNYLYQATDRALCFDQIIVVIPTHWHISQLYTMLKVDPDDADIYVHNETSFLMNPYTEQYGSCGSPGRRIHFSSYFFTNPVKIQHAKIFLKEWAKYRYGVFDEYGFIGDPMYPAFENRNFTSVMTSCVASFGGIPLQYLIGSNTFLTPACYLTYLDLNTNVDPQCDNDLYSPFISTSLMFGPKFFHMESFCDKHCHNSFTSSKQNTLCDGKSVMEVLKNHPDFRSQSSRKEKCLPQMTLAVRIQDPIPLIILDNQKIFSSSIGSVINLFRNFLKEKNINGQFLELGENKSVKKLLESQFPDGHGSDPHNLCLACAIDEYLKELDMNKKNFYGPLFIITEGVIVDGDMITTKDIAQKVKNLDIKTKIIIFPFVSNRSYDLINEFAFITQAKIEAIPEKNLNFSLDADATFQFINSLMFESISHIPDSPILLSKELAENIENYEFAFGIDNSLFDNNYTVNILAFCQFQECSSASLHEFSFINDGNVQKASRFSYHSQPNVLLLTGDFRVGSWQFKSTGPRSNFSWLFAAVASPNSTTQVPSLKSFNNQDPVKGICWSNKLQAIFEITEDDELTFFVSLTQGPLKFVQEAHVQFMLYDEKGMKILETWMKDDGLGNPDITRGDGIWSVYVENLNFQTFYKAEAKISYSPYKINKGSNPLPCCGSRIPESKVAQAYFYLSRVINCGYFFIRNNQTLKQHVKKLFDLKVFQSGEEEISVEFARSVKDKYHYRMRIFRDEEKEKIRTHFDSYGVFVPIFIHDQFQDVKLNIKFPKEFNQSNFYYAAIKTINENGNGLLSRVVKFFFEAPKSSDKGKLNNHTNNEDSYSFPKSVKFGAWKVVSMIGGIFIFIFLILLIITYLFASKMRRSTNDSEKKDKLPQNSPSLQKSTYHAYDSDYMNGEKSFKNKELDNQFSYLKKIETISPIDSITVDKLMDHYGKVQKAKQRRESPPVMRLEDVIDNVSSVSENSRFQSSLTMDEPFIQPEHELSWKYNTDNSNQIIPSQCSYIEPQNYFLSQPSPMINVWRNSLDRSDSPSDYDPRYGTVDKKVTVVSQV